MRAFIRCLGEENGNRSGSLVLRLLGSFRALRARAGCVRDAYISGSLAENTGIDGKHRRGSWVLDLGALITLAARQNPEELLPSGFCIGSSGQVQNSVGVSGS